MQVYHPVVYKNYIKFLPVWHRSPLIKIKRSAGLCSLCWPSESIGSFAPLFLEGCPHPLAHGTLHLWHWTLSDNFSFSPVEIDSRLKHLLQEGGSSSLRKWTFHESWAASKLTWFTRLLQSCINSEDGMENPKGLDPMSCHPCMGGLWVMHSLWVTLLL